MVGGGGTGNYVSKYRGLLDLSIILPKLINNLNNLINNSNNLINNLN